MACVCAYGVWYVYVQMFAHTHNLNCREKPCTPWGGTLWLLVCMKLGGGPPLKLRLLSIVSILCQNGIFLLQLKHHIDLAKGRGVGCYKICFEHIHAHTCALPNLYTIIAQNSIHIHTYTHTHTHIPFSSTDLDIFWRNVDMVVERVLQSLHNWEQCDWTSWRSACNEPFSSWKPPTLNTY